MHASNKQRTWKNSRKIGPATIITFPRLPTPLDAVRRWLNASICSLTTTPHSAPSPCACMRGLPSDRCWK